MSAGWDNPQNTVPPNAANRNHEAGRKFFRLPHMYSPQTIPSVILNNRVGTPPINREQTPMELRNVIARLAGIAGELDAEGRAVEAAALTRAATRVAQQLTPYIDNERVPPSQRMWDYKDQELEFRELDESRNKDPRYMTPEYQTMSGGLNGPADEGANENDKGGLSIFDMGGKQKPIVTGPARMMNEEISPATSPLEDFSWQNTRGQWDNAADSYKKFTPRR